MYLIDYLKLGQDRITEIMLSIKSLNSEITTMKKIICLNTLEIFDSTVQIEKYCTASSKNIKPACLDHKKTRGTKPITNEKLHWKYFDDYSELSDQQKNFLFDQYYTGHFLLPKNKKEECK